MHNRIKIIPKLTVVIFLFAGLVNFISCSKDEENDLITPTQTESDTYNPHSFPVFDPELSKIKRSGINTETKQTSIKLSVDDWQVKMMGSRAGKWYFNRIHEDNVAAFYDGVWEYENGQIGKAAAIYYKRSMFNQPMLVLSAFYNDGDVNYNAFYPYTDLHDETKVYRFYGVRHWVRDTEYYEHMSLGVLISDGVIPKTEL